MSVETVAESVEDVDKFWRRVSQNNILRAMLTCWPEMFSVTFMLVTRWQAQVVPSKEQIKMIFAAEGLEPQEEVYPVNGTVKEHRHPFDEIRMVVAGELFINVAGNQLLLRSGDRIEIPSNTRHETVARGSEDCVCIYASRVSL